MKNRSWIRMFPQYLALSLAITIAATAGAAAADDEPTIAKDAIRVTIQNNVRVSAIRSDAWLPRIEFRVNGPIASGSRLSAEFTLPTKPKWVGFDCDTGEIKKGEWWKVSCGGLDIGSDKAVFYSGPVGFTIRIRNELLGTNATLFTGKAKVGKVPKYPGSKEFDYYVDDDWTIPIGYVFYGDSRGAAQNFLSVGFSIRGNSPEIEAHLFYKGTDIAKCHQGGLDAGGWDPSKPQWGLVECYFPGVYETTPPENHGDEPRFGLRDNPGEYEVKVLIATHLARSIKFTVGADGSFDNGIATANKLGSDRVIVPVKFIGDHEGPWDKLAWKTGAFYGNPLTGFAALP